MSNARENLSKVTSSYSLERFKRAVNKFQSVQNGAKTNKQNTSVATSSNKLSKAKSSSTTRKNNR